MSRIRKSIALVLVAFLSVSSPVLSSRADGVYSDDGDGSTEYELQYEEGITASPAEGYLGDYVFDASMTDSLEDKSGLLGTSQTFTVTDTITATFNEGILTFSGSGAIPDYEYDEDGYYYLSDTPWKSVAANVTQIIVGEGITSIGGSAFVGCYNAESLSLPNSLNSIGEAAFLQMGKLTSLTIPGSVTQIPTAMVYDCKSLKEIKMGNVTSIGAYAFGQSGVSEINIPASVTEINSLAFFSDDQLTSINVDGNNPNYMSIDGIVYSKDGSKLMFYPPAKEGTSFSCKGIKTIDNMAFGYAKNLVSIDLSGVTTLEESAFQGAHLTSVSIPDSVTTVGMFTFYECVDLKEITFGNGLTETSYQMFENCKSLETINFGSTLSSLYARTFAYCNSLKSVSLPANITNIGNACFGCCEYLESVTMINVEQIPFQAFLGDVSLKEFNFGNVKIINRESFVCSSGGLRSVNFPASVELVNDRAFNPDIVLTSSNPEMKKYGINGLRLMDTVKVTGEFRYDLAFEVLDLVNNERANAGLSPLTMEVTFLDTSMDRAAELTALFSHTRPDGSAFFAENQNVSAENIAVGSTTAADVMNQWMNSDGHRANILNEYISTIGVGCFVHNGEYYWVQNFGSYNSGTATRKENVTSSHVINLARGEFDEAPLSTGIIFSFGEDTLYSYSYKISANSNHLDVGATEKASMLLVNPQWSCAILDDDCVNFSSSDPSIATIDANGNITGIQSGTVTISTSLKDGTGSASFVLGVGTEYVPVDVVDDGQFIDGGSSGSGSSGGGSSSDYGSANYVPSSEWINGQWYGANGDTSYQPKGQWKTNGSGWWYEDTSGWYPWSQWTKIDGKWYYFDYYGYMASAEWRDGYYLSGSGAWEYEGVGSWHSNSKGWWFGDTTGWYAHNCWQKINGKWYYFDASGYMVTSKRIDGYWIGADGVCQ